MTITRFQHRIFFIHIINDFESLFATSQYLVIDVINVIRYHIYKESVFKASRKYINVQIRFKVCDSIRFERFRSIISLGFYNLFFAEISNIKLTLHIQMLR